MGFRVSLYINKMDRMGADFERGISMMRERLGANPVAIQLPIAQKTAFLESSIWFA